MQFNHTLITLILMAPATTGSHGDAVSEMSKSIWCVFEDKKHHHWFGSNGEGLYHFDGKTLTRFSTKQGLAGNQIRGIQQHQSGDLFINTTNGISRYDGTSFTTLIALESKTPDAGWKLQPDDLWFAGAQNTGVVYRYDGKTLFRLRFPATKRGDAEQQRTARPAFPFSPYDVYTIYRDRQGSMWFGTAMLGVCRYDGKTFDWLYEDHLTNTPEGGSFGIRSILEDKAGKFWFCNTRYRYIISPSSPQGNGLIPYQREPGVGNLQATLGVDAFYFASILEDKKGDLWMTSYREGVWRYDGKNITRYLVQDGNQTAWSMCIYQDSQGVLWLGTNNAGVYRFNGKAFEKFRP